MFLFQSILLSNKSINARLDEFNQAKENAIKSLDAGTDKKTVIAQLNNAYNNFFMGIRPDDANKYREQINKSYNEVVFHYSANSGNSFLMSGNANQSAQNIKEREAMIENFTAELVSNIIYPKAATFYGASAAQDMPSWANNLAAVYHDLVGSGKYGDRDAFKDALSLQLSKRGVEGAQKELILGLFEGNPESFADSMRTLTRTQMAIDGISLIIKNAKLGGTVQESEIRMFFPDEDKAAIQRLIALKDSSAITSLLDRIENGSLQNRRMMELAIDANYGENAAALKELVNYMAPGKVQNPSDMFEEASGNSLQNLKQFYENLLSPYPGAGCVEADAQRGRPDRQAAS
jgi:hypothetical protein